MESLPILTLATMPQVKRQFRFFLVLTSCNPENKVASYCTNSTFGQQLQTGEEYLQLTEKCHFVGSAMAYFLKNNHDCNVSRAYISQDGQ